jgi:hypothetical protein
MAGLGAVIAGRTPVPACERKHSGEIIQKQGIKLN